MTHIDLNHLETLASNRKRWPTMGEIGELRHGTLALITRIRELETDLQRVRDARSNHPEIPECDRYTDDDTIKCGWKSAIKSIDKALEES